MNDFEKYLENIGIDFEKDANVSSTLLTSKARLVVKPDATQVPELRRVMHEEGLSYWALGSGSNTLLMGTAETPLQTVIVDTKKLRHRSIKLSADREVGRLVVGAGLHTTTVSRIAAEQGLAGLEFAAVIPGTIAGAVATDAWHPIKAYRDSLERKGIGVSNIPGYMHDVLHSVQVTTTDGDIEHLNVNQLKMGNKESLFTQKDNVRLILCAIFELPVDDPNIISKKREAIRQGRTAIRAYNKMHNPYSVEKTLGCPFVALHPGYGTSSAAELIATSDSLDNTVLFEGMQHSKLTPNIICNTGDGTATGYLRLADHIQRAVYNDHGTELQFEPQIVR